MLLGQTNYTVFLFYIFSNRTTDGRCDGSSVAGIICYDHQITSVHESRKLTNVLSLACNRKELVRGCLLA